MFALPEGMSEADYEAIEAAVMETVRGRWFLAEFARRSRVDEMRQMLDAMARLEQIVREQQVLPADPSVRLLLQRLKDVAQGLDRVVAEMRGRGLDERFCAGIETQARAVLGLLRLNNPAALAPAEPEVRQPLASPQASPEPTQKSQASHFSHEMRRAALTRLEQLSITEKLALFA
jgi:hypothetical protein